LPMRQVKKSTVINIQRAVCNESCSHGSESSFGKSTGQAGSSPSFYSILNWNHIHTILGRHDIVLDRSVASPYEGLVLGNADMGATIFSTWGQTYFFILSVKMILISSNCL